MKSRKSWKKLADLFLLLLLVGCKATGNELSFKTLAQSSRTSFGLRAYTDPEPTIVVLASLEDVEAQATLTADNPDLTQQLRQLDYEREFAILVLQGYRGQGGSMVTIEQAVQHGRRVDIRAEFLTPEYGEGRVQAYTSPFHAVAVTKGGAWDRQVRFVLVVDSENRAQAKHFIP